MKLMLCVRQLCLVSHLCLSRAGVRRRIVTAALLACLCAAGARAQTTLTVNTLQDLFLGSCSGTCSLRDALHQASTENAGDRVVFASGLTGTITLTGGELVLDGNLSIAGPGANLLTISGNKASRIFNIGVFNNPTVNISGLTISDGNPSTAGGGAIELEGPVNSANNSTLKVTDCVFTNNSSNSGGAILSLGNLTVIGSTFSGNHASTAGAIDTQNLAPKGLLTVIDSTFTGNTADFGGGAISANGDAVVVNSTFVQNSAEYGGAIDYEALAVVTMTASNNIFSGNTASAYGGALTGLAGAPNGPMINADHTVYYHNSAAAEPETSNCGSCHSNSSAVFASSDPLTMPLGYYGGTTQTLLPQPGSAAICAGSASLAKDGSGNALTIDQRGFLLSSNFCLNGGVDAGAVQSNYLTVTTLSDQSDLTTCTSGTLCSLRDAFNIFSTNGNADIIFNSGLVSTSSPGTITLGSALPDISGQLLLIGPGANQLTVNANGSSANRRSVFTLDLGSEAIISGLTISGGNASGNGGGINSLGTLSLLNSAVSGNTAAVDGGGIFNGATMTITDSTISGNSAVNAGGIYNDGTMTLLESTVANNTVGSGGSAGGILTIDTMLIEGSTISGNSASANAGGIYVFEGTLGLSNSVVAGNTSISGTADSVGSFYDFGGNVLANLSPQLTPLQYNGIGATVQTMIPMPGSPAICAGLSSNIPTGFTTDERGYPISNATYTGYSSGSPCVDAGAVQTNYTGVSWVQQPTATRGGTVITPSPSVKVIETNSLLSSNNTDVVLGVPVTLILDGGLTLSHGTLTQPQSGISAIATFNDLTPNSVGTGYSFSTNPITVTGSDTLASVTSSSFDVNPQSAPVLTVSFTPNVIPVGGTSTLTLTFTNPADNTLALTGVGFDDTLPSGLSIGSGVTNSCGQILASSPGEVSLAGVTLAVNSSCTVTIPVSAASGGVYTNTAMAVSGNGGNSSSVSAKLQAGISPPSISASFSPDSIGLSGASTLTITLTNPNGVAQLTGIGFSDTLPTGLSTVFGAANTCGQIVSSTSTAVFLSNVTLAANSSCQVTVPIIPAVYGDFQNSTGAVTSNEAGTGNSGSATLTVISSSPTVTGISPATGPPTGGTAVTITGTSFNANAVQVNFGLAAATNVTVVSATTITATSPPGTGTVDVTVTTPTGTTTTGAADQFAYVAPAFVVNTTGDDGSGVAANCTVGGGAATCTLRDALAAASSAGSGNITFSPPVPTITVSSTLNLPSITTIQGPATISGGSRNSGYPVFTVASGVAGATVSNLTITQGGSTHSGGIDNSGSLNIDHCTITQTSGGLGGAIYNNGGTLYITDSTFTDNHAGHNGGGLWNDSGTATVVNSTLTGNGATIGAGAILVFHGTVSVNGSTISDNFGNIYGGGIYNSAGTLTVANSIVSGNQLGTSDTPGNYDDIEDKSGAATFAVGNGNLGGNVIGYYNANSAAAPSSAANLTALGNYGGSTQTMLPLPGSAAICGGLVANIPTGITTDQRGLANINTSYSATPCVDAGAVQTNYALAFTQQPSTVSTTNTVPTLVPIAPAPAVSLTENGIGVSGVQVSLTDSASFLTGPATATTAGGIATFSGVGLSAPASGDTLTSTIALNSTLAPPVAISATSYPFNAALVIPALTSPTGSGPLSGAAVTFSWTSGSATQFVLSVGTTKVGSSDVYRGSPISGTSVTVSNVPTAGATLYVRLGYLLNGAWTYLDYTFTEDGTAHTPVITSPGTGTALSGATADFVWDPGAASQVRLNVGTLGAGSADIYQGAFTTATTAAVSGIPVDGGSLYVRLNYVLNGVYASVDYEYTEAGIFQAPELTSPAPASTLPGTSANFGWSPGSATSFQLRVGTTGPGSSEIFSSAIINGTSVSVAGIPATGATLFVRLSYLEHDTWKSTDYTYTESGTFAAPAITAPASNSTLTGSSATFTWTPGSAVKFSMVVGTTGAGSGDVAVTPVTAGTSQTISGIPSNGATLFVQFKYLVNGAWSSTSYQFTESGSLATPSITSPVAGTQLVSSTTSFTWTPGSATRFKLFAGTTGPGSSDIYDSTTSTTVTTLPVTGIPSNGGTLFVRLSYQLNGTWTNIDYFYGQPGTPTEPALTSPSAAAQLSGSNVFFQWTRGSAWQFQLTISGGGSTVYDSGITTAKSATAIGLPTDGSALTVRLSYRIGATWAFIDYPYTAAGALNPPAIISPTPGSTLTGSTANVTWTAGSASRFKLCAGTQSPWSDDLYCTGVITTNAAVIPGVPTSGGTLYVRLKYYVNGAWKFVAYTYTESGSFVAPHFTGPAATLTDSNATFTWAAGSASQFQLRAGTTAPGSGEVHSSATLTGTSIDVSGIPTNGAPLYVRLLYRQGTTWKSIDSTYTEAGTLTQPALATPAPGSTLAGSSANFTWTPGSAVRFYLCAGTTVAGSVDVGCTSAVSGSSANLSGIPTTGNTLFLRFNFQIGSSWNHIDYTFVQSGAFAPPSITSPDSGSPLTGSSATFAWSPGSATTFQLSAGTSGAGSREIYQGQVTNANSATIPGIPETGAELYLRLAYLQTGVWKHIDYFYMQNGALGLPALTSPLPGSTLSGDTVTFTWSPGSATRFSVCAGTTGVASTDVGCSGIVSGVSASISGIPTGGNTLYVRLNYMFNGAWSHHDYTYNEAGSFTAPSLQSPGTPLPGSNVTFSWNPGSATWFMFRAGTSGVGSSDLYNGGATSKSSVMLTNIPTAGAMLYVRLYYLQNDSWRQIDYTFTEAGTLTAPAILSPAPGTTLSGSTATFTWDPGSAALFEVTVHSGGATGPGIYTGPYVNGTSMTIPNLPTGGGILSVRLYYMIDGVWNHIDATYTEAP